MKFITRVCFVSVLSVWASYAASNRHTQQDLNDHLRAAPQAGTGGPGNSFQTPGRPPQPTTQQQSYPRDFQQLNRPAQSNVRPPPIFQTPQHNRPGTFVPGPELRRRPNNAGPFTGASRGNPPPPQNLQRPFQGNPQPAQNQQRPFKGYAPPPQNLQRPFQGNAPPPQTQQRPFQGYAPPPQKQGIFGGNLQPAQQQNNRPIIPPPGPVPGYPSGQAGGHPSGNAGEVGLEDAIFYRIGDAEPNHSLSGRRMEERPIKKDPEVVTKLPGLTQEEFSKELAAFIIENPEAGMLVPETQDEEITLPIWYKLQLYFKTLEKAQAHPAVDIHQDLLEKMNELRGLVAPTLQGLREQKVFDLSVIDHAIMPRKDRDSEQIYEAYYEAHKTDFPRHVKTFKQHRRKQKKLRKEERLSQRAIDLRAS